MFGSTGIPQRVLLVGGSSEIAGELARQWARLGVRDFVLTTRLPSTVHALASELRALGANACEVPLDAAEPESLPSAVDSAWVDGDIDVAVVALGVLRSQSQIENDPVQAWDVLNVNATATIVTSLAIASRMEGQGYGTLVLLSSVAGVRGRRDNYVYGSSKAAIELFAEGLRQRLAPKGIRVLVARPGYVHSRMSRDIPPAPFSVSTQHSANAIVSAVARTVDEVWIPHILRPLFWFLRHLPRAVWWKLVARVRPD